MNLERYLRPTVEQWENNEVEIIAKQLMILYAVIIVSNNLSIEDYKPVLVWNQLGDDFIQNRITLRISAQLIK